MREEYKYYSSPTAEDKKSNPYVINIKSLENIKTKRHFVNPTKYEEIKSKELGTVDGIANDNIINNNAVKLAYANSETPAFLYDILVVGIFSFSVLVFNVINIVKEAIRNPVKDGVITSILFTIDFKGILTKQLNIQNIDVKILGIIQSNIFLYPCRLL